MYQVSDVVPPKNITVRRFGFDAKQDGRRPPLHRVLTIFYQQQVLFDHLPGEVLEGPPPRFSLFTFRLIQRMVHQKNIYTFDSSSHGLEAASRTSSNEFTSDAPSETEVLAASASGSLSRLWQIRSRGNSIRAPLQTISEERLLSVGSWRIQSVAGH